MTGVVSKQTVEKFTSTAKLEGKFSGKSHTIVEIFVLELKNTLSAITYHKSYFLMA